MPAGPRYCATSQVHWFANNNLASQQFIYVVTFQLVRFLAAF